MDINTSEQYVIFSSIIINKIMFDNLNYYSRYHRIKNPYEIPSLLDIIDKHNLSISVLNDSTQFCLPRYQYRQHSTSPIKIMKESLSRHSQSSHDHKRHASYDPYTKYRVNSGDNKFQNEDRNRKSSRQNQLQELQPPRLEQNNSSMKNRTNLEDMNCLQTESIQHGEQSGQFSECEQAHFPIVQSKQNQGGSEIIDNGSDNQDNFSSVKLNAIFDLRKNSMQQYTPFELEQECSKSECLQRGQLSDIQMDSSEQNQNIMYGDQRGNYQNQDESERIQMYPDQDGNERIHQHQEYYEQQFINNERGEQQSDEEIAINQTSSNEIREENHQKILDEISEASNEPIEEGNGYLIQTNQNLSEMYFGYEEKEEMRLGYENYAHRQIDAALKTIKQAGSRPNALEQNTKIQTSIIDESVNTASKISVPERKPFKKYMMNKKLNPRMATSTIVNDLGDKKPQKINFKKILNKQKSENRVKFEDIVASRTSKKNESPKKNTLLQAFFEQN